MIYLFSKLNTNYIIKRERTEKLELPEEALREALINAIVHRDYFLNGHIQVDIFIDRVEISNPGGLVSGLKKKDFGKISMTRNPLIMDLMLRAEKVEKVGTGIRRIQDSMKAYGLKVKFESAGFFYVIFERSDITKSDQKSDQKVLELISQNKEITIEELIQKLNLSSSGIKKIIKKLKNSGKIKRIGPDKGGYWEILE